MELKDIYGDVIFALESAKTVLELVTAARAAKADLSGADLSGADLSGADLSGAYLSGADLSGADLSRANLRGAYLRGADLSGADLRGANLGRAYLSRANLRGAYLRGKKVAALRIFCGLYRYTVQAVLFQDGSRWVRMGCIWKSLEEWESVGIRKSNLSQFPDDGSDRCEERVAAFEFAKAAALRLKENQ